MSSKKFEFIRIYSKKFEDFKERVLIMGKTVREIADILGTSPDDLIREKQRIRERLIGNVMDESPNYDGISLWTRINQAIDLRFSR